MDDPRHQRVRRLVNHGFTPRMIGRLEDELRRRTRPLLDAVADTGRCDFVTDISAELPMQVISFLLGVPEDDRHQLFEWMEHTFDFRGSRAAYEQTDESIAAALGMWEYGSHLIEAKRATPGDDMLSIVVHAELPDEDPPTLSSEELGMFFSLLFAAGAETTRNATAGGLLALVTHPGELPRLQADPSLLPTTIEEAVRWTSPSAYNRRTATIDVEFAGQPMRAGDKVVFWEASANRDELVFGETADRFDAGRSPNPHLAFGHGVHHCLGANLARLEMRVIYEEFLGRFEALDLAGEPEWTRSNKHTGLRHLPISFRPR
jgi:cytochrome P450